MSGASSDARGPDAPGTPHDTVRDPLHHHPPGPMPHLAREPVAGPAPSPAAAADLLDVVARDLYRRAAGQPPRLPLPIRVFDDPAVVRGVLTAHEGFDKNYDFLTDLAVGRLSCPGGAAWQSRAALTQPWFRRREALDEPTVRAVYRRHLDAALAATAGMGLGSEALFDALVLAGVEVFSLMLGLAQPLPWARDQAARLRALLARRQLMGWLPVSPQAFAQAQEALADEREQLRAQWQAHPAAAQAVAELQQAGAAIDGFDAVQELLMGAMAASETTASALLWCVEILARQPQHRPLLADAAGRSAFATEVLRLFPPVPMMTRRSLAEQTVAGVRLAAGESLAVSVVGVHTHPGLWDEPLAFRPQRWQDVRTRPADWLPFSRGPRVCAGMRIAQVELSAALQELHGRVRYEVPDTEPVMKLSLSLRPHSALRLHPA